MTLYLDDMRPCPVGATLARTVAEAIAVVQAAIDRGDAWDAASLDHDLGACQPCLDQIDFYVAGVMPYCEHVGTGQTFVRWMIDTGTWPRERPTVHSMNPDGRRRMEEEIARYFSAPA